MKTRPPCGLKVIRARTAALLSYISELSTTSTT
jgi:hypothetical protein